MIAIGHPPTEINSFQIGINNSAEIISAEAKITERHQIMMDKNGSCSNSYTKSNDFIVCSKKYFTQTLYEETNCSLPGNFKFLLNLSKTVVHILIKFVQNLYLLDLFNGPAQLLKKVKISAGHVLGAI